MIRLYDLSQSTNWDSVVRSFGRYDVYYLSGYVRAFYLHGDGQPFLLYYEANGVRAIYVYMRRETSIDGVYDSITPYGYGGVLFDGEVSDDAKCAFWKEYSSLMAKEHIVDNFVRYHPILKNAVPMKSFTTVLDLGKTVAIDLSSPEIVWENIISKNRNMIRKAEKNGIKIFHSQEVALFHDFKRIYNATMDRDNAESYYYFEDAFYESIHKDLHDHYEMFYAVYDEKIIAVSIILFANGLMHYHLSGSLAEYRNLAPTNMLLYNAAIWGCKKGFKTFHLGGGVGSGEDSLYKFKAAFNRNSDYQFSIGKQTFNEEIYNQLVEERRNTDPTFNEASSYFPLYRQ